MNAGIKTVGIAGAGGTMGAGIAIVAARAGFATVAYDLDAKALERARRQTEAFLKARSSAGKLSREQLDQIARSFVQTTELGDLGACDLVIEAIFEDLATKQALFRALHQVCPQPVIFASNTSTLSITEIASGCGREDRLVGMHFCLPAQLMKLIELSPGLNTSEATLESAWRWCEAAGQTPVRTEDRPGFILNALLVPFNNDAIRAVEAGLATPADIDQAVKVGLGHKMGPCELVDLIGLDTQLRLCEALFPITLDPRAAAPPLLRRMVAAGRLGRKAGLGFFRYQGNVMFGG